MNSPQTFWINHNSIGEFHGREKSMAADKFDIEYKGIPQLNKSTNRSLWYDEYNTETRNKVAEIYKKDIEMFSYDWS